MESVITFLIFLVGSIIVRQLWLFLQATWWRRVNSTWAERWEGRMQIATSRLNTLHHYMDEMKASQKKISGMDIVRVEGALHSLADAQRKDKPDTPSQIDISKASVRYLEIHRDMLRLLREDNFVEMARLTDELEGIEEFLSRHTHMHFWDNPERPQSRTVVANDPDDDIPF